MPSGLTGTMTESLLTVNGFNSGIPSFRWEIDTAEEYDSTRGRVTGWSSSISIASHGEQGQLRRSFEAGRWGIPPSVDAAAPDHLVQQTPPLGDRLGSR